MKKAPATAKKTAPNNDRIPVGRIAGIFGIRGELKCDPTSAGRTLFIPGAAFEMTCANGEAGSATLETVREHKGRLLIAIDGVQIAEDAQRLAGATLYAARERIELQEGEYLDRDLVGCALEDSAGSVLGIVQRVEHYPGSDMLIVDGRMVPMVAAFIKDIDTGAKRIVAELPPGLLSEDE